jgi:hypothetical protein
MWESAGIVIRGVLTQAITKSEGPFADGDKPGEDDCEWRVTRSGSRTGDTERQCREHGLNQTVHIITWLARMVTNVGVAPGTPAAEALPKLQAKTGGHNFDPALAKYWE